MVNIPTPLKATKASKRSLRKLERVVQAYNAETFKPDTYTVGGVPGGRNSRGSNKSNKSNKSRGAKRSPPAKPPFPTDSTIIAKGFKHGISPEERKRAYDEWKSYQFQLNDLTKYSQNLTCRDTTWRFEKSARGKETPWNEKEMLKI